MTGIIVSDKMIKTVVVKVDLKKRHPKYHKAYTVSRKFKAHDENNEFHIGDKVVIESTKPISKEKKFKVVTRITRGSTTPEPLAPMFIGSGTGQVTTADQNADQR